MINQAEGGALPLTFTPLLILPLLSLPRSVSRQVWLQPVTDVPHCQAAKDVLADAADWPACQAPGLQSRLGRLKESDRRREWMVKKKKTQKEQKEKIEKEHGNESEGLARSCM